MGGGASARGGAPWAGLLSRYSRKGKRFPVIGRDGKYFWVLPKSGGQMIPAKKAELMELRSGFPNFAE